MNTFDFVISSPEGKQFEDKILAVFLRGSEGDIGIFAGHIPFVTTIVSGNCTINCLDGTKKYGEIKSGILSVAKDKTTLITSNFEFKTAK